MDIKTFVLARPAMDDLPEGVDLTGWGEPLMNPYLPAFFESVKNITFTTNAHLLDNRAAQRIVANRIGAVAISIDTACDDTYRILHSPGDPSVVWGNVRGLREARDKKSGLYPLISLHFLMMSQNIRELPQFVERAAKAGCDEVVAKHIALFSRPGQEKEALFTGYFKNTKPDESLRDEMVAAAVEKAREMGIKFRKIGSDRAAPMPGCFGGAITRPFVAVDGSVSPCCVLSHPAPRLNPECEAIAAPTLFFGNVHKNSLEDIWNIKEYEAFREGLRTGNTPSECRGCLGAWSVTIGS